MIKPPEPQSTLATAPGKVILFGEHAVVYGRPAIAVPVQEVQAQARIEPGPAGQGVRVVAPDVSRQVQVRNASPDDPLAHIVRLTLQALQAPAPSLSKLNAPSGRASGGPNHPDLTITVTSTVPIARGMGSGAALSTAIVRALARHFSHWLPSQAVSDLVYQTEVLYHGTPSGIDNTVIAFEKPVYFVKDSACGRAGKAPALSEGTATTGRLAGTKEIFWVSRPFWLAIADTGVQSSTREVVADLRRRYEGDPACYEALFDGTGEIALAARRAIEQGQIEQMGRLMDRNHTLLQQVGVSCAELDRLVVAAREGGALGAKLSGAGWGGNAIALVTTESRGRVDLALRLAGATDVIVTQIQ